MRILAKVTDRNVSSTAEADIAHLVPLCVAEEGVWNPVGDDTQVQFPDRGKVFWYQPNNAAREGSYWSCKIEVHPNYEPGTFRSEQFQVVLGRPVREVIDLRQIGAKERRWFVAERGLTLKHSPLSADVMFILDDETWAGPVNIEQRNGRWFLSEEDPTRIDVRSIPVDGWSKLLGNESRFVVGPKHEIGEICGYCNWATDHAFASNVLKRIRSLDREAFNALEMSYRVFDEYIALVSRIVVNDADKMQDDARVARINDFKETIEGSVELIRLAAKTLSESDDVQSKLQEEVGTRRNELLAEAQSEIHLELGALSGERDLLRDAIHDLEKRRTTIEEEIAALECRLVKQSETFESRLAEKLRGLVSDVESTFADLAIVKSVLGAPSESRAGQFAPIDNAGGVPIDTPNNRGVKTLIYQAMACRSVGSMQIANSVLVSFAAGAVPILVGKNSLSVVEAFGAAIAGGRVAIETVRPQAANPYDLIFSNDGGLSTFARAIQAWTPNDSLSLVVLDSFNLAPAESYLLRICEAYRTCLHPMPHKIPLLDEAGLIQLRPWPPNILLAVIAREGLASYPITPEIWPFSTVIDARFLPDENLSSIVGVPSNARHELRQIDWLNRFRGAESGAEGFRIEATLHECAKTLELSHEEISDIISRIRTEPLAILDEKNSSPESSWDVLIAKLFTRYGDA